MLGNTPSQCQKPSCTDNPENIFRGEHGNELRLCERHYYELVADTDTTPSTPFALSSDLGCPPNSFTNRGENLTQRLNEETVPDGPADIRKMR